MPEREYLVYEEAKVYNVFAVRARNQGEAVEKVKGQAPDESIVETTIPVPTGKWFAHRYQGGTRAADT